MQRRERRVIQWSAYVSMVVRLRAGLSSDADNLSASAHALERITVGDVDVDETGHRPIGAAGARRVRLGPVRL